MANWTDPLVVDLLERAGLRGGRIEIVPHAPATPAGSGAVAVAHLGGPPWRVELYEDTLRLARIDPLAALSSVVAEWEHDGKPGQASIVLTAGAADVAPSAGDARNAHGRGGPATPAAEVYVPHETRCPVCLIERHPGEAERKLALVIRSARGGRIAPGAGGVIPIARSRIRDAIALMPAVEHMVPGRTGEARQLWQLLLQADRELIGWLDLPRVRQAHGTVERAWWAGGQLALAYYGRGQ